MKCDNQYPSGLVEVIRTRATGPLAELLFSRHTVAIADINLKAHVVDTQYERLKSSGTCPMMLTGKCYVRVNPLLV